MDEKTFDLLGREVAIGDTIAAGFREGNDGVLRVGKIVGFSTKSGYPKEIFQIDVEWSATSRYSFPKKSSFAADSKRFVILRPIGESDGV